MKKEFVPYQQSLQLKELGFDEPCFTWYWDDIGLYNGLEFGNHNKNINYVSAPTFSQAFRFFREKYDLFISIFHYENGYSINDLRRFETYEEAEIACLNKLIEIVKNY
jgi:hypothetical protein